MRVLITATEVATWSGAELYAVEVAKGLSSRGHEVAVHAIHTGPLAKQLRASGIPILRRQQTRGWSPDVVHAQGRVAVRTALAEHPEAPVLFVCHGHDSWNAVVSPHPNIRRYAGVSQVCTEALLRSGSPPDRTILLPNFVDTSVFTRRRPLPQRPQRALMFSNYAKRGGYVEAVDEACSRLGLPLDRIGSGAGTATSEPAAVLPHYDVVFAKGRAAIEAMAVGCAVVLCDFAGVGSMVTLSDFDRLRIANFGFGSLTSPHGADVLYRELCRYDPNDASLVCDRIRREASLERYLDELEEIYQVLIEEVARMPKPRRAGTLERTGLRAFNAALRNYHRLSGERRRQLRPLTRRVLREP